MSNSLVKNKNTTFDYKNQNICCMKYLVYKYIMPNKSNEYDLLCLIRSVPNKQYYFNFKVCK